MTRIRYIKVTWRNDVDDCYVSKDNFLIDGCLCKVWINYTNSNFELMKESDEDIVYEETVSGNKSDMLKRVKKVLIEKGIHFHKEGRNRKGVLDGPC